MRLRALLPCAFTVGNMVSGFLAIAAMVEHKPTAAAWFIILGAVFDGLDGLMARAVGGESRFGRELDSFADFVTFGVAPMVMLYDFLMYPLGFWTWIICGVYLVAGGFRLIRFNLSFGSGNLCSFQGLPITSSGICLAGYVLLLGSPPGHYIPAIWMVWLILGLSMLMISSVRYAKCPLVGRMPSRLLKILLFILLALPIILAPQIMIFGMILAYILAGVLREAHRFVMRDRLKDRTDQNIF